MMAVIASQSYLGLILIVSQSCEGRIRKSESLVHMKLMSV